MKKFDFWFLFRFLLVTALYDLECFVMDWENFMILDTHIFPFILAAYLLAIIASFFFDGHIRLRIKIISDIAFLSLFAINAVICFILMRVRYGEPALPASICLFLLSPPMFISFIVWFIRDKKKTRREEKEALK